MGNHSKSICIRVAAIFFMGIGWVPSEGGAAERKYPNRPIQVVIAAAPGGTDLIFRPFTEKMAEVLGQPMAFVFKPGASGMTGASFVAQSKPDGYTLIGTSNTPVMIAPLTKEADYSIDDFVPICRLVKTPLMVAVRTDSPWKSIKDIAAEAKKSPGLLTFSTSGVFSFNHLLMEMFTKHAGIQLTMFPARAPTLP